MLHSNCATLRLEEDKVVGCYNDIQEILSRIGHYNGVSPEVAERILARQIVQSRYTSATDDEEKEEIIYKTVSEELLKELDLTKEQVAALELEKNILMMIVKRH